VRSARRCLLEQRTDARRERDRRPADRPRGGLDFDGGHRAAGEDRVLGEHGAPVVAEPADHGVRVLEDQHAGDVGIELDVAHAFREHVHVRPSVRQRQHVGGDHRLAEAHRPPPRVLARVEAGERARQRPAHRRLVDLDLALVDHGGEV
jgi:hypothetical protein